MVGQYLPGSFEAIAFHGFKLPRSAHFQLGKIDFLQRRKIPGHQWQGPPEPFFPGNAEGQAFQRLQDADVIFVCGIQFDSTRFFRDPCRGGSESAFGNACKTLFTRSIVL